MIKKHVVLFLGLTLFLTLLCSVALATDYNITGMSGILNLPAGTHTITGAATDLSIVCAQGVTLTANGVEVTMNSDACALRFNGTGNELILAAGTTNSFSSGYYYPGIAVDGTSALTISGSGTLNATGGVTGAGIGGGYYDECGTINITGGNVTAASTAFAAGIGGGDHKSGGIINISGGTVTATGSVEGAGIGGGARSAAGTITISGGTVTADSTYTGAGIGSGFRGYGGSVEISGGIVYAASGDADTQDIGNGGDSTGVTFTLSNSAAVFLENDRYVTPTLLGTQMYYKPVPFVGNTANGITVPAAWTIAQSAFLPPAPMPVITPQTGDSSRMGLWIALAGLSAAAVSFALLARRKRRA